MLATQLVSKLLVFSLFIGILAQDCPQVCQSFGEDFVDGGMYFQNVQSTDPFTATEYFAGCQNDTAYNVLQDPHGNQVECDKTPMVPDGAVQNLICPINKNQLVSGEWSILVLSNNGQCEPIAYIRTFFLNVGTQATTTVAPTVVVSLTSTPAVTTTKTTSRTITSTAKPSRTTVRSANPRTFTITPLPSIVVITKGIISVTQTIRKPSVVTTKIITTTTPCVKAQAKFATKADKTNTATSVTVIKDSQLTAGLARRDALAEPTARPGSLEHKRVILRHPAADPKIVNAEIKKRAPDPLTVTVTSGTPVSSTMTITAATTTVTATTTTFTTTTTTPTVTVTSGHKPPAITTAPRPTITATLYLPITVVTTTKYSTTLTITSTASKCSST